jgi:hypothetical protein
VDLAHEELVPFAAVPPALEQEEKRTEIALGK